MVCDSDAIFKVFPGAVLDTLVAFWDPFGDILMTFCVTWATVKIVFPLGRELHFEGFEASKSPL